MDKSMLDAIKLDRKKPYGTVIPPHEGAHYEQGGLHFDNDGDLVEKLLGDEDRKRLERMANQRAADKVAAEARAKFLREHGLSEDDVKDDALGAVTKIAAQQTVDPGDVDLIGWAKGQVKYQFFTVRAAFEKQFQYTAMDKKGAIEFLIKEGKIAEDDVKA